MTIVQALVMSVVEGLTEFLPVSSTGHLILTASLLGIPQTDFAKSFEIIIQAGAILAVTILYAKRFVTDRKLRAKTFLAFLPTATVGFVLYKVIKRYLLGNPYIVVSTLALGGIILILLERRQAKEDVPLPELAPRSAFTIGIYQTVSIIPGVSRSAATIVGGLRSGLSRADAVLFSFYLAIPTMAAATGYDLLKSYRSFSPEDTVLLAVGFLGAFVTAWVSMKWFLGYVRGHSLAAFGWYRIAVAAAFLLIAH